MTAPALYAIETASGRYIDLAFPQPDQVTLEDVAHGLSMTCRFAGQSRRFYSVAEHAVRVHEKVRAEHSDPMLALAALHHDDAEAYLGDVPRPLKLLMAREAADEGRALSTYRELETGMDYAIWHALALPDDGAPPWWYAEHYAHPLVKDADAWCLMTEARALMPSRGEGWTVNEGAWGLKLPWPVGELADPIGVGPDNARQLWLHAHREGLAAVRALREAAA